MNSDQAYILHRRPFSDNSEIIYFLTQTHGILHSLAKGSKNNRSKFKGQLQAFTPTTISWSGKSSLKTLTQAEQSHRPTALNYPNQVALLYLNELILIIDMESGLYQQLFKQYQTTTQQLSTTTNIAYHLRRFEWFLCCLLGYRLQLPTNIKPQQHIVFSTQDGLIIDHQHRKCQANDFLCLTHNQPLSPNQQKAINWLMRPIVHHLSNGKPIKTRELWQTPAWADKGVLLVIFQTVVYNGRVSF